MRALPVSLAALLLVGAGAVHPTAVRAESSTDLGVLIQLAEERYAEGNLERSAELYLEIAARHENPDESVKALFTASWLLFLAGQESEARDSLTRALTLAPDHPFDPALYTAEFESLYHQALRAAQSERSRRAATSLRQALEALEDGRTDVARSSLIATLDLDPDDPTALYNLALIEMDRIETPELLTRFEKVVTLTYREPSPEMVRLRARALTGIGVLYHRQKRWDDARQAFIEATRAEPREASAWQNLAGLHLDRTQYAEAADALERAHELLPDDRDTTRKLANALHLGGRSGQAAAVLKTDLQRHPDDPDLWLELGTIEAGEDNLEEAVHALERAIDADPDNRSGAAVPAATRLAEVRYRQKEYGRAVEEAQKAVVLDPVAARAWAILGRSQLETGDTPAAIASLSRAADLRSDSIDSYLHLADAYVEANQLEAAEGAYLKALSIDPGSADASAGLEAARSRLSTERAIVNGKARPRKPIQPKHIGVQLKDLDYEQIQLRGALVKEINKKSPAARAGLRKGDLILWIGSYAVLSDKDFFQYIKRNPPGETLHIEYLRDGRIHEATIQLR